MTIIQGGLIGSPLGFVPGGVNPAPTIPDNFYDVENTTSVIITPDTPDVFEEYINLTIASIPDGRYRIGWHTIFTYEDDKTPAMMRVQLNNINVVTPLRQLMLNDKKGTPQRQHQCGFAYTNLVAGTHILNLGFSSGDPSKPLTVYEGRIEIWRTAIISNIIPSIPI